MKRDLGPKDLIFPAPVLIVGTYGQDGTPNAMNVAWGGICSSVPPAVAISIRETRRTFANIQAKGAFTVAIATEDLMVQADYVGLVSGNDTPDKIRRTGWTVTPSRFVNAPLFEELPVTWECEFVRLTEEGNVLGRLVNISVREDVLAEDGTVNMEKFKPLVFDHATYDYLKVDGIAGKAFEAGKCLM